MASISSIISLVVLLLATYCYSVPVVTDYDYTTSGYDFSTGKPLAERESTGLTLPEEYTTVFSTINHKRGHVDNKHDSESDELTTQRSYIKGDHQKRSFDGETTPEPFEATSMGNKRFAEHDSSENESHEKTTQRSGIKFDHQKRSFYGESTPEPFEATSIGNKRFAEHDSSENESHEKTTQRSTIQGAHQKRHSFDEITSTPFEDTSIISERSVDMELSGEFTTERSLINEAHPKRDSSDEVTSSPFEATSVIGERSIDTEVSDDLTTERSYAERGIESDSFTTFESSTQFNNRVGHFGQRESVDMDITTDFEPTSSDESFSHATGLLHQEHSEQPITGKLETEQPETYYRKTETIVPGKITKTELRQGENQSYTFKGLPVEQQVSSFSEGTTEENDSKTNTDH